MHLRLRLLLSTRREVPCGGLSEEETRKRKGDRSWETDHERQVMGDSRTLDLIVFLIVVTSDENEHSINICLLINHYMHQYCVKDASNPSNESEPRSGPQQEAPITIRMQRMRILERKSGTSSKEGT
jgi:hypothetical protein